MNFYEMLEELEEQTGTLDKEVYLAAILRKVKNAESFFRFAFNDQVFGVKEQTFKNAFNVEDYDFDHVSDYLATTVYESLGGNHIYKVPDLIEFGPKLITLGGHSLEAHLANFIRQCEPLKKKWFCRAILKDLRCGIQVKTVNKVFRRVGLKEIDKFAMQLCEKIDIYCQGSVANKIKFPCSMECKYDGYRMQAEIFDYTVYDEHNKQRGILTNVKLTSRRGKIVTDKYPEVVAALKDTFSGENIILDGEIIASSFQELTRSKTKSHKYFVIFDILNDEKLQYISRWDNLYSLCHSKGITEYNSKLKDITNNKHLYLAEHYNCNTIEELQEYYEELNKRKEEGVVIKLDNKPYDRGSRKNMFKCKKVYTVDLLCTGYKLGTGKRSSMVSTLCLEDKSGTIKVDVGSGIDDDTSMMLTEELQIAIGGLTEIKEPTDPDFIDKIVEIKYNEITSTGSIRFPRFVHFRNDKDEADDLSIVEVRQ